MENRTDLPRITLCKEALSCYKLTVNLRRRLISSKDEFLFNFVFVLQFIAEALPMLYCLLGEVFSHLFYSKQPVEVN